jgi:hypothetical protein
LGATILHNTQAMSDSGPKDGGGAAAALRPAGRRAGNEGWQWAQKPLRVSAAGRSLEDLDGRPCFYLADTAWMCLWKGTPEQWERYFDLRVAQGYSVIQTDLLPFEWGKPDAAGNLPFVNEDFSRPNDAYFARAERF